MRFGLFGSAQAARSGPDTDSGAGYREFVDRNIEAEDLGFCSTFLVEHHFTGFGQVSATLSLLTWVGARHLIAAAGNRGPGAALAQSCAVGRASRDPRPVIGWPARFWYRQGLSLQRIRWFLHADGRSRRTVRGKPRRNHQSVDIGQAVVTSWKVLALRKHLGRAAHCAEAAPAVLDGRRESRVNREDCRPRT